MSRSSATELVCLRDVTYSYTTGPSLHAVLRNVSLSIPVGQSCAISGASGSGKSTLLNLIGLLDAPTSGCIVLAGQDMSEADADMRAMMRNQVIGFVFQGFNLLPRLDAVDNVALPLIYRGVSRRVARQAALSELTRVGLSDRSHHRPPELSGGQCQRVAIARALVCEPSLLLADEPTGNLDSRTAGDIIDLLLDLNRERGTTLVLVTHDDMVARRMARQIHVRDGWIEEEKGV